MKVALYLHFPYCVSRCTYCDFNAYQDAGHSARAEYIEALCEDIRRSGQERRYRVTSLFCGGGTPSLHSAQELGQVLASCRQSFEFHPDEVTLEANPGTVSLEQLRQLRQIGFNRLSLGVQSFESRLLERLNRIHSPQEVHQAVDWARQAGFDNLSLDLIYGLPGQTFSHWKESLEQALELQPQHLSVYQLTVEPGTHLESQLARGELSLPNEDRVWKMDRWMRQRLRQGGLRRYEVSNWAQPGFECRHNLVYWRDQPYLGLGCGATGYVEGWRIRRWLHPAAYLRALQRGGSPVVHAERRDQEGALKDFLMMGLRTREGTSWRRLTRRFPGLRLERLRAALETMPATWWHWGERRLRLSKKGSDFVSSLCQGLMDFQLLAQVPEQRREGARANPVPANTRFETIDC